MYKFRIINNNKYLEYDNELKETVLSKFFDGDIILNNQLEYSEIRETILVGYFSTSQSTTYGKIGNKKLYIVTPFKKNLPKFLVTYKENPKVKGKILIRFKYLDWNRNLPRGVIEGDIIGNMNNELLFKTLKYHYNINFKKTKLKIERNMYENKIKRKKLNKLKIISVDPSSDCQDIDDAISYSKKDNSVYIGIHIAQPIYWLNKEDLDKLVTKRFSSLYYQNKQENLFGDELTQLASLKKNEWKPAYSIIFRINNYRIDKTYSFPSLVNLHDNLSYDSKDEYLKKIYNKTKGFNDFQGKDYHDLISYWMIKANNFIGIKIKDMNLPFRVNKILPNWDNKLENEKINEIFSTRNNESANYSLSEFHHGSLDLEYYTHFTSPIRRIIDTIIHFKITYNVDIKYNLDKLNKLDKNVKKFHNNVKLNEKLDSLEKLTNTVGYIYNLVKPNLLEIYTEELGFVFVEIFKRKFEFKYKYIIEKNKIKIYKDDNEYQFKIGDEIDIIINKIDEFLPHNKFVITLKNEL